MQGPCTRLPAFLCTSKEQLESQIKQSFIYISTKTGKILGYKFNKICTRPVRRKLQSSGERFKKYESMEKHSMFMDGKSQYY